MYANAHHYMIPPYSAHIEFGVMFESVLMLSLQVLYTLSKYYCLDACFCCILPWNIIYVLRDAGKHESAREPWAHQSYLFQQWNSKSIILAFEEECIFLYTLCCWQSERAGSFCIRGSKYFIVLMLVLWMSRTWRRSRQRATCYLYKGEKKGW